MKSSAAVPPGTAQRRRDLTKLMPIIFARCLASLTVYVASSQSAPLTHSLPFIRLFSFPIYLAQLPLARLYLSCARSARPLHRGITGQVNSSQSALFILRSFEAQSLSYCAAA